MLYAKQQLPVHINYISEYQMQNGDAKWKCRNFVKILQHSGQFEGMDNNKQYKLTARYPDKKIQMYFKNFTTKLCSVKLITVHILSLGNI